MKKTINVLSQGFSDDIDILSENEMDEITGGDVDCKRKYVKGHVECHKRYKRKAMNKNFELIKTGIDDNISILSED